MDCRISFRDKKLPLCETLCSAQYSSIERISSRVIISLFNAKVARNDPDYNMHFIGCLQKTL